MLAIGSTDTFALACMWPWPAPQASAYEPSNRDPPAARQPQTLRELGTSLGL
jgi:hypothetical protein